MHESYFPPCTAVSGLNNRIHRRNSPGASSNTGGYFVGIFVDTTASLYISLLNHRFKYVDVSMVIGTSSNPLSKDTTTNVIAVKDVQSRGVPTADAGSKPSLSGRSLLNVALPRCLYQA